jgi:Sortilin, neurotensin receptor 3,
MAKKILYSYSDSLTLAIFFFLSSRSIDLHHTGSSWPLLHLPTSDSEGHKVDCNPSNMDNCSLHLHSVTILHNFRHIFSSPAPGFIMGVGSIGLMLHPYNESDTFLSTDAGMARFMVHQEAHKYEFSDQGSIIVTINDEEMVNYVSYLTNLSKTWCVCTTTSSFSMYLHNRHIYWDLIMHAGISFS